MKLARKSIAGAFFVLAGCASGVNFAGAKGVPTLALLGGDFVAAGPAGYCADRNASRPQKGFAILAPCAVLGVQNASPAIFAMTTVQVGQTGSAIVAQDPVAFSAYLEGPNGPQLLSRTGNAGSVSISDVTQIGDQVLVHLVDDAPAVIDGAQRDEWRAFFDVAGRLVTIAVRGLDEAPLTQASGDALLSQTIRAIIGANAQQPASEI